MNSWRIYNKKLFEFTDQVLDFNRNNNFNYSESGIYNHIRDLLAIVITSFDIHKKVKILDYGSNTSPWSNLKNKIFTKNLDITIFDPFAESDYSKQFDFGFNVNVINNLNFIQGTAYDLIIFGSSSQYIPNFLEFLTQSDYFQSEKILFTNTAFSKKESFVAEQKNSFKGKQFIRSYDLLRKNLARNDYIEIFKSTLPKDAAIEYPESNSSEVIILNILFTKLNN